MVSDRWEFVKEFVRTMELVYWRVFVDREVYCDLGFPEDEEYASIIEVCTCMVEGDEDYAGKKVNGCYLNPEKEELYLYMGLARVPEDWWRL